MKINIIVLLLCFGFSIAQKPSGVAEFTVSGKASGYNVFPTDSYLFLQNKNQVKITPKQKGTDFIVKVTNGTVVKGNTEGIFIIENLEPAKTLLSIYERRKDNSLKLVMNKPYNVIPFPAVKIAGVKSDSAITPLQLAAGTFYAEFKGLSQRIKIKSFKMECFSDGKFYEEGANTSRLTPSMLEYISKRKAGDMLFFKDFKFTGADGIEKIIPVYRVFIIDDETPARAGW